MSDHDRRSAGFKVRTPVDDALGRLLEAIEPHDRVETVALRDADGLAIARGVDAPRPVPHYPRAAMDGYAVRSEDTFGASDRSPAVLRVEESAGPEAATRVHTGSEVPPAADAVVMVEQTREVGDEVEVYDAVAGGENVAPVGEDVAEGDHLYDPGHRLRPSDLGLLKAVGVAEVAVYDRTRVSVIPTGDELVQAAPEPGEVIETNGQTVTQFVERWGGRATYRDVVRDDVGALGAAIEGDLDHDVVVTTGGSSVGERDLLPEVLDDLGDVLVHGVSLRPGHPVALGVVDETPVIALPGYPVACIVNAVQFLRPTIKSVGHLPRHGMPRREATLARKVRSEPGIRTFARVRVDPGDDGVVATPIRSGGAGVLSSVALADGWVVVAEEREGIPAGEDVEVEDWEWSA